MDRIALQILEDGLEQDGRAMQRAVALLQVRLAEPTDGRWAAAVAGGALHGAAASVHGAGAAGGVPVGLGAGRAARHCRRGGGAGPGLPHAQDRATCGCSSVPGKGRVGEGRRHRQSFHVCRGR